MLLQMCCVNLRRQDNALLTKRATHLNALHHFEAERLPCGAVLSATFKPRVLESLQHTTELSAHANIDRF